MSSPTENTIEIGNRIGEIGRVTEFVGEYFKANELPEKERSSIELVLEELLSNAIFYGTEGNEENLIRIRLDLVDDDLWIRVEDEGREFDPNEAEPPTLADRLEDQPIGGFGIHLVRQIVDSMSYAREGNRNQITLIKRSIREAAS